MVTIVDYKSYKNEDGEEFFALVVQGDLQAVKSKETNKTYFTAKKAQVTCTFTEDTCKSLIGTQMPGTIKKVEVEAFEYADPDTGEINTYSYRNVYMTEEEAVLDENLETEEVI